MIKTYQKPGFITLNANQFKALMANDFASMSNLSPYANWTETDVLNHLDIGVLIALIRRSSYARKVAPELKYVQLTTGRSQLLADYQQCRHYATESIISSLYPVNQLTQPVTHIDCAKEEFYILSRVRTKYEAHTVAETAAKRTYLSFTLINSFNLSHFPGSVWYGFRSKITPDMIGLILSYDADTRSWARNRQELGANREELLDATDLTVASLRKKTYSQLSIKSKALCVPSVDQYVPVTADCILCIDKIDDLSKRASDAENLPIIVLHPGDKTFCRIHDFCKD